MKKKGLLVVLTLILLVATFIFSACSIKENPKEQEDTQYKIQFNTNGGSKIDDIIINSSAIIQKPLDPTKEGYTFVGWYSDEDFKTEFDFTKALKKDTTIYARWQKDIITIHFNTNGGTEISDFRQRRVDMIALPNLPIKEGYTFKAWCLDEALTQIYDFTYIPDDNINLYVKWEKNDINVFSITLRGNGGRGSFIGNYNNNEGATLPTDWVKQGYDFVGWYEEEDFSGPLVTEVAVNTGKDVIYYAKWKRTEYLLEYVVNQKVVSKENITVGQTIELKPYEGELYGYTFDSWSLNQEGEYEKITSVTLKEGQLGLKVYARWIPKESEIIFEFSNGDKIQEMRDFGSTIIMPNTVNPNYELNGWYLNSKHTGMPLNRSIKIDNLSMHFYAKLTPKVYNIELDYMGGVDANGNSKITLKHTYGEELSLPNDIKKNGDTLVGWAINTNGEDEIVHAVDGSIGGDQNLFAVWEQSEYIITLNTNGGILSYEDYPKTYLKGQEIELPICIKEGYNFLGWENQVSGKVITKINPTDFGNKKLIAKFEAKEYTLAMVLTDKIIQIMPFKYNAPINLGDPQLDGYTYNNKWYVNKEKSEEFVQGSLMPKHNLTLYADLTPKEITITFDTSALLHKEEILPINQDCGTPLVLPEIIQENRIIKWFTSKKVQTGETYYNAKVMPGKDLILYAREVRTSGFFNGAKNITYYDEDATLLNLEPKIYYNKIGEYLPTYTKEGYDFLGWCDGAPYTPGDKVVKVVGADENSNKEYYAAFKPKTSTIKYVITNEYDYITQTHTYGVVTPLKEDITRRGYKFAGWYLNPERSGQAVTRVSATDLSNKVFYAKWERETYTITLDGDGGSGANNVLTYTYGEELVIPTNWVKKGYNFICWKDKNNTAREISKITAQDSGNFELIATWRIVYYQVILEGNNGTGSRVSPYYYQEEKVLPTDWVREGYTFAGWYLDKECKLEKYLTIPKEEIGDLTFYAKWASLEYNITLSGAGGSGTNITKYKTEEGAILPTDWVKEGYTFAGWYTSPNCYIQEKVVKIEPNSVGDKRFFAKWTPKPYSINFYTGEGASGVNSIIVDCGDKISLPINPTKPNNIFSGWYLEAALQNKFDYVYMPAKDLNLYAKWDKGATLRYVISENKTIDLPFNAGATAVLISDVEKQEWNDPYSVFEGWYLDDTYKTKCPSSFIMDKHYTVYAKWARRGFIDNFNKYRNLIGREGSYVTVTRDNNDRELIELMDCIMFFAPKHEVGIKIEGVNNVQTWGEIISDMYYQKTTASQCFIKDARYDSVNNIGYFTPVLDTEWGDQIKIETQEPYKVEKIGNGIVPVYEAKRSIYFNNFKIDERSETFTVRTSNQLYYALQYGYKPDCIKDSQADLMYKAAKDVAIACCDDSMSNFEKVYSFYLWIIQNVVYDHKAIEDVNDKTSYMYNRYPNAEAWHMEGVFNKHLAVCDGMSKAFVVLCSLENIPCVRVVSEGHAWNKVYLDLNGDKQYEWYNVDPTWGSVGVSRKGVVVEEINSFADFLFKDEVMKEGAAPESHNAINQFDIVANTDVNPYEVIKYQDNDTQEVYDCVIENKNELQNIIKEANNNIRTYKEVHQKVSINFEWTITKNATKVEIETAIKEVIRNSNLVLKCSFNSSVVAVDGDRIFVIAILNVF